MTRLRRAIPAGLADAGLASLATFVVGLYAAGQLEPAVLGVYALHFSAFTLAAVVPGQLLLVPAEVAALRLAHSRRLSILPRSVGKAAPLAVAAGAAVLLTRVLTPSGIDPVIVTGIGAGAAVSATLSPLQDHVRKMLHLSGRSWGAAAVSLLQLLAILVATAVLHATGVRSEQIPFGALAIANAVSLAAGLVISHPRERVQVGDLLVGRALVRSGRWLLVVGMVPSLATLAAATLIAQLASAEALGVAEAARVLAQPLIVLGLGLSSVLGPRSMEAASRLDRREARRYSRVFLLLLTAGGVGYAGITGAAFPWNPLGGVLSTAYLVPGIAVLTIAANVANGLAYPYRSELIGGKREARLASIETAGGIGQVAVGLSAATTGAFAKPLGGLVLGAVRLVGSMRSAERLYGDGPSTV